MPIGFKNATDGSIKPAADSCFAAAFEHHFLSINLDGRVISAETKGNPDCHLVLRGSSHGPNYDAASVAQALADLKASKASGPSEHGLIIDAAHGRTRCARPKWSKKSPHASRPANRAFSAS